MIVVLTALFAIETAIDTLRRWASPTAVDVWQELEKDPEVKRRLLEVGGEGGYGVR